VLLVLTTLVSLEAIYLSIFIQMAVNRTAQSIKEVEEDFEEIPSYTREAKGVILMRFSDKEDTVVSATFM
jgi:hypothetical protein